MSTAFPLPKGHFAAGAHLYTDSDADAGSLEAALNLLAAANGITSF